MDRRPKRETCPGKWRKKRGDNTFQVERILAKRETSKAEPDFLIKWDGYDEISWEPQANLSEGAVEQWAESYGAVIGPSLPPVKPPKQCRKQRTKGNENLAGNGGEPEVASSSSPEATFREHLMLEDCWNLPPLLGDCFLYYVKEPGQFKLVNRTEAKSKRGPKPKAVQEKKKATGKKMGLKPKQKQKQLIRTIPEIPLEEAQLKETTIVCSPTPKVVAQQVVEENAGDKARGGDEAKPVEARIEVTKSNVISNKGVKRRPSDLPIEWPAIENKKTKRENKPAKAKLEPRKEDGILPKGEAKAALVLKLLNPVNKGEGKTRRVLEAGTEVGQMQENMCHPMKTSRPKSDRQLQVVKNQLAATGKQFIDLRKVEAKIDAKLGSIDEIKRAKQKQLESITIAINAYMQRLSVPMVPSVKNRNDNELHAMMKARDVMNREIRDMNRMEVVGGEEAIRRDVALVKRGVIEQETQFVLLQQRVKQREANGRTFTLTRRAISA